MESDLSDSEETSLSTKLVDHKYEVDFSQLMNLNDEVSMEENILPDNLNIDGHKNINIANLSFDSTKNRKMEEDESSSIGTEEKYLRTKDIVVEDDVQIDHKDPDRRTCDIDLNEKFRAIEKASKCSNDENDYTQDENNYEFVKGDVRSGSVTRDAKIVMRSTSEHHAFKAVAQDDDKDITKNEKPAELLSNVPIQSTVDITNGKQERTNTSLLSSDMPSSSDVDDAYLKSGSSRTVVKTDISSVNYEKRRNSPKNLSPLLIRKKALRLPTAKRHSRTIFYEDVLSAYDIIDRTDVRTIDKIRESRSSWRSAISLANIKSKFKHVLTPGGGERTKMPSTPKVVPDSPGRKVVTVSVQETQDGEPMQVITLSRVDLNLQQSRNRNRNSSMIIYVDDLSGEENDQNDLSVEDFSDVESDQSSICQVDDIEIVDQTDSIHKTGFYTVNIEKNEEHDKDTLHQLPHLPESKMQFKGPSRMSQSFGGVDRAQPKFNRASRRTTFAGMEFEALSAEVDLQKSAVQFDAKRLKRTLPNEPFHLFTDSYPTQFPSFPSDRRSLIAQEVYTTERTFVRGLEIIVKHFKARIEFSGILDAKEIKLVFSDVDSILDLNHVILDEIFERLSNWSDEQCIADIFLDHKNDFKIYSAYCKNYDSADAFIKQRIKKKRDLEALLKSCYSNPICVPGLTLPSYLITVIQRTPRYILLLKDLLRRTPSEHPDHDNLVEAVNVMEKMAAYINDQLKQSQCRKALEVLETQISGLKAYYIPERSLVHEGPVCLLTSKKTYQCILFNDLLVFAVKGTNKQSIVELALELKTVWFEDLQCLDPQTTKNDAIGIYTPDRPYTMYVGSNGEKKIWLRNLQSAITECLFEEDANENADTEKRESSYTYKDGSVYSGTYLNSKRHGEGTMMWPNQMTYRGHWEDDERNGYGLLEYVTGEVYDGLWKDHKQDGLGTFKYTNGDTLSGDWKNGLRHGQVFISYKNGDKFVGKWRCDRIEGDGELECVNGLHYEGQWRKNLKHGKGKLQMPDGSEYNGYFLRGKFHGNGELTYVDGSMYKGEFERGERCGNGRFAVPGGNVYEGQWMHDLKDGRGKMLYENGDEYDGTWVQDMRIGKGIMVYNFGGCYRGQWSGDLMQGNGIREFKDGSSYDGEWANNKINGYGTMKYKNGNMFKGFWVDNCPDGAGILTRPGGWSCDGKWAQGKQHGYCVLRDPMNGCIYEGEWSNGCKEGKGIEKTRFEVYEGEFVDDLRDGYGCVSLKDGTIFQGYWQRGGKHGKQLRKLVNGLTEHQLWENGCLVRSPVLLTPREMPNLQRWM